MKRIYFAMKKETAALHYLQCIASHGLTQQARRHWEFINMLTTAVGKFLEQTFNFGQSLSTKPHFLMTHFRHFNCFQNHCNFESTLPKPSCNCSILFQPITRLIARIFLKHTFAASFHKQVFLTKLCKQFVYNLFR